MTLYMPNESFFLLSALIDIFFVFFAARRGINWLFGTIITNLILIGVFGAKLITAFGIITNAGNVFYACVFLATYFILERYGRFAAVKTIWLGVSFTVFFVIMAQFATRSIGLPQTSEVNNAITTLFTFSPRVVLGSVIGFAFAQLINIKIYEWIKAHTKERSLWLRSNGANIISQLVDSMLFFSIAFFDLPGPLLAQAILAGWTVKILVVSAGVPLLYIDRYMERKKT